MNNKALVLEVKPDAKSYKVGTSYQIIDDASFDVLGIGKTAKHAWGDAVDFLGITTAKLTGKQKLLAAPK